ncbi:MAG: FecR domain-containing protein [Ginsengibacter sp.]
MLSYVHDGVFENVMHTREHFYNMNEARLKYLFEAYFEKTASEIERSEFLDLINQSENDWILKDLLTEAWLSYDGSYITAGEKSGDFILKDLLEQTEESESIPRIYSKRNSFFIIKIAAAAVIAIVSISFLYLWLNPKSSNRPTLGINTNPEQIKQAIRQGGEKAILTLSDGTTILLDSNRTGVLAIQSKTKITIVDAATITYNSSKNENSAGQEVSYNTLSTHSGGRYKLILPDGSLVWLNSSSSIHFPTRFTGVERKVVITGEAYFEVTKNKAMPFTIAVNDMEVQVLGTHFNIMAYSDENTTNTTLLEGSVKVIKGGNARTLQPGQESRMNKYGKISVAQADIEEVMAWKNGWFQFNEYDIQKVMRQISRWYDVEVIYSGSIPDGLFSGIVSRSNNISVVLKIIEGSGVRFKIDGKKIVVL